MYFQSILPRIIFCDTDKLLPSVHVVIKYCDGKIFSVFGGSNSREDGGLFNL